MYYQNKKVNIFRVLTNFLILSIIFETIAIYEYLENNKTFKPKIFMTKNFTYKPIIDITPERFTYTNDKGLISLKENSDLFNPPLLISHSIYNVKKKNNKTKTNTTATASASSIASAEKKQPEKALKIIRIKEVQGGMSSRVAAENKVIHKVRKGDSLWKIAKRYGLKIDDIAAANKIAKNSSLKVGQKLTIVTNKGFIYKVKNGDSLWRIGNMFNINYKALAFYNNLDTITLKAGKELVIPWTRDTAEKKYAIHLQNSTKFRWPCATKRVTSPFGFRRHPTLGRKIFHTGIDIGVSYKTVRASLSGTVSYAGWIRGYGKIVIIKHKKGYSTKYAHLSSFKVSQGTKVLRGQAIGKSGNTGITTGPHLHFEIRKHGKLVNPKKLLPR
ncbi:M23 family metallopeptidase [bacterium]|nr:M23 family metallopeptidase [bacterium]